MYLYITNYQKDKRTISPVPAPQKIILEETGLLNRAEQRVWLGQQMGRILDTFGLVCIGVKSAPEQRVDARWGTKR